ncbi:type I restriction endonuclease subunit R [Mycoplasmopsis columboralis]|uniref:Type I restriction enzyme endonuclease subunit n=1 Tax=Mycoplasmopsis columboralis TaxID=171282 RepID=A0A449B7M2_9BACT|nr:type I restriction endonuclease subunit R [Mycoplasmopsis columboralis]VEU76580.1 type I restriction system endonuclease [Mycoplasmopsis columboralis]
MKPMLNSDNSNWVVIEDFKSLIRPDRKYQSEAELEDTFIQDLQEIGYEYAPIKNEPELVANLRVQIENLNNFKFNDDEWKTFYTKVIANDSDDIFKKTENIQKIKIFNTPLYGREQKSKNIKLIDEDNIFNNKLQVINQYNTNSNIKNRYDVTILVNGLPLVQVELKRRGVSIKEAFNQIERYQDQSYSEGAGLFKYIQLFVISNGTHTKYYSNTTRFLAIKERKNQTLKEGKIKTSNSFEFAITWADQKNNQIHDLVDFTKYFLRPRTILSVLTKYCVLTSENKLLVMRPYQITAAERIAQQVNVALNHKNLIGTTQAGGYIWHSTGSGKTLTSFKISQILAKNPEIRKVLFVVDRKDLDYQTIVEFEKYEKGSVSSTSTTKVLEQKLNSTSSDTSNKIIVTTIQKLNNLIRQNKKLNYLSKNDGKATVIIFDECHRSQFGDSQRRIKQAFKDYILFGFTGTPIFGENSSLAKGYATTKDIFGEMLHSYTIADAIKDGNVLKFNVQYNAVVKDINEKYIPKTQSQREKLRRDYHHPKRIEEIVAYTLDNYDKKTLRNFNNTKRSGFNSIFAADSIEAAGLYYLEFKKQIKERNLDLKIATIYTKEPSSYASSPYESFDFDPELSTEEMTKNESDILREAINDHNQLFGTNYSMDKDGFDSYYKGVSAKVKERKIDILIVCSMFLTGFDAVTLNTLWVDKDLSYHNLIQAYSRTNRIYNSYKHHGNIVTFRNLEKETNEALRIFNNAEASQICLLRKFDTYFKEAYISPNGRPILGFKPAIEKLREQFPLEKLNSAPLNTQETKDFVDLFGDILLTERIVKTFDEFYTRENYIFQDRERQDYQSWYLQIRDEHTKKSKTDLKEVPDDLTFHVELIKTTEYDWELIVKIAFEDVKKHVENENNSKFAGKETIQDIKDKLKITLKAQDKWRNNIDIVDEFIDLIYTRLKDKKVSSDDDINLEWNKFVRDKIAKNIDEIITTLNLRDDEKTRKYIYACLEKGDVKDYGTEFIGMINSDLWNIKPKSKKLSEVLNNLVKKFKGIY